MELFLKKGYEATNIREICFQAGIEPPTVYYYFGSKKGLFFSIYKDMLQKYYDGFNRAVIENADNPPEQKLFSIFIYKVKYAIENLMHTQFRIRYSLFPPVELAEEIQEFTSASDLQISQHIKNICSECIQKGLIQNLSLQQAEEQFSIFIANCQYDIVFLNQRPDEQEMIYMWTVFSSHFLGEPTNMQKI